MRTFGQQQTVVTAIRMKMSRYLEVHPLAAFLIILLGAVVYVLTFISIGDTLYMPQAFGNFVAVWLPVLLSGIVFLSMCRNTSASKKSLYWGALATAIFAPTIAWQLVLFVGFAFLGWQM